MAGTKHTRAAFVGFLLSSSALIGSSAFADGLSKTYTVTQAPMVQTTVVPDQQMEPMLNVGLSHCSDKIIAGQPVAFRTYWNYDSFIQRAVIEIFDGNDVYLTNPVAEIPVNRDGTTSWNVPPNGSQRYFYVLKVIGNDGSWDRTVPQIMTVTQGYSDIRQLSNTCGNIHRTDYTGCRNIAINGSVFPAQYAEYGMCAAPVASQPVARGPVAPVAAPARPIVQPPREPMSRLSVAQGNLLETSGIRVKSECNRASPMLNVGLFDGGGAGAPGQPVTFDTYTNYDAFVQRGEVRVFDATDSLLHAPIAVIPVSDGQPVSWTPSKAGQYEYVYRVYGTKDMFDETVRKKLTIAPGLGHSTAQTSQDGPIYGEDATRLRNIKVSGGTVTVYGQKTGQYGANNVIVYGKPVRVDQDGDFAFEQIIPAGSTQVPIGWSDAAGQIQQIAQPVTMDRCNWTFVGLGEITVGADSGSNSGVLAASGDENFDETFVNASGSFYLKGKVRGDTILTAALNVVDDDIENAFTNLEDKSAQGLLRRIEPNKYYPVYGDDSTIYEDAPTQGRLFVKLENGDNHVMWGNFTTKILDTELSQIDRGLYGAKANVEIGGNTSFGERRAKFTGYAAEPGSVATRDEFRGTGGSVYFLRTQDVTIGSERLRVEVRDPASGLVLETRELRPYIDYEVDYIQGRVILSDPLQSTTLEHNIVRDGSLSGNSVFLVARYEAPTDGIDLDALSYGGRGKAWLGDYVGVGITGEQEESGGVERKLYGADITLRAAGSTYLKAEVAQSSGSSLSESTSLDGGYSAVNTALGALAPDQESLAYRVEAAIHSGDFLKKGPKFELSGYLEDREQDFSAPGKITPFATKAVGGRLSTKLFRDRIDLSAEYDATNVTDETTDTVLQRRDDVSANARVKITDKISAGIGARYSDIQGAYNVANQLGHRTDVGGELRYDNGRYGAYVFGQETVDGADTRLDGTRYGVGGDVKLTDKINVRGEVSEGEGGLGALAEVAWKRDDGEEYYLNYNLDADHSELGVDGTGFTSNSANALTVGGRRRFSDSVSVYGEERATFGERRGLTHAYGVDYSPTKAVQLGAGVEMGQIEDGTQRLDREAYSLSAGYAKNKLSAGAAFELRNDTVATVGAANTLGAAEERETQVAKANASVEVSENWRAMVNGAYVQSTGATTIQDANFTQANIAAAYRPVDNDRLNALFRYTYLKDLPPEQQSTTLLNGTQQNPGQESHVLSADANYKIGDKLTIGGKYGYRMGETETLRGSGMYNETNAHLGILRADLHVVKKWDALLEGRIMQVDDDQTKIGALAAIYRHLGNNFKAGVGYNFTDFSDDLTDLTYDDHGVFVNLMAKF